MPSQFKPILTAALLSLYIWCGAQSRPAFVPLQPDPAAEQRLLEDIQKRHLQDLKSLSGPYQKYLAELYKERYGYVKARFTEKEVLCAEEAQNYLDALVREIITANSSFNSAALRIVFSRSFFPNASSMGEGTIFFNLGLFHRLQNESQAAFVLCHELAHYFLNHSNDNILQYVSTVYSDEFQGKLKDIQKSGYGRNSQLEALSKNLMFKNRRHSRAVEHAADSMALELMKNTRFDVREALSCLALLDSADKDKYAGQLQLEKQVNFPSFAFRKSWVESDDLVFGVHKKEQEKREADSLKTHPDCSQRIEALKSKVAQYFRPGTQLFVVNETTFHRLRSRFDFEIIAYCFESRQVTRALYYALQTLPSYPGDAYLTVMVGKCLNEIYSHQKRHELGKIVDLPGPQNDEEYNALLRMVQNMRLQEIGAFAYHFLKEKEALFANNEDFTKTFNRSKEHYTAPTLNRF